ncbi:DUF771 domain-containing protein [Carnobacterium mobile]|uniref:DUF771 domain-containing protein n=1 Tax=Carnobacterium mobile TaxID=2750 RepID=UPI00054FCBDB|nr:DUF771 domain-containing protein [Carnobacterium mobile]
MQQLEAIVKVVIPEEMILVKKVEYEELQNDKKTGWGNLQWLLKETEIKSPQTIKEKVLYPFRQELEDFVYYPDEGQNWKFNKKPMVKWLEENFKRVWNRKNMVL